MGKSGKVSMKLLIDVRSKRVLFAEASKDCVDFLFYILSLPVSSLINLVGKHGMVGSMSNLYESLETLEDSYIQPNKTKSALLKPVAPHSVPLLSFGEATDTSAKKLYSCGSCYNCPYVSEDPRAVCRSSGQPMTRLLSYAASPGPVGTKGEGSGLVKEVVTYMVMDDLVIKPMSIISSITLLNTFNVKDVGALQEKVVKFGINEAVKLVKASLESKKVLTNVFLNEDTTKASNASRRCCLSRSRSLGSSTIPQQQTEKEAAVSKRRCLRKQSTSSRTRQEEELRDDTLIEIDEAKFLDLPSKGSTSEVMPLESEGRRTSISRPSRKAAEKVQSYKERPINAKMKRPE